jgi:hypothetical protein
MWTKPEEKEFLISHLKKTDKMLEWGSGFSTLELPAYVKSLISIEHHQEWFIKVSNSPDLPSNAIIKYIPPNQEWKSRDGNAEEFLNYINGPYAFAPFDVIFIDGRARVECARNALNLLAPNGKIFFHDFGPKMVQDDGTYRKHYDVVLNFLEVVDSVETMYLFKAKS